MVAIFMGFRVAQVYIYLSLLFLINFHSLLQQVESKYAFLGIHARPLSTLPDPFQKNKK